MATVKNTIDKFGRKRGGSSKLTVVRGPPGVGFNLTTNNHFDIQNKRLTNIGDPIDQRDGVTRKYVDQRINQCMEEIDKTFIIHNIKTEESYTEFVEKQMSEYSKFIYGKITEMIGEVRQYIDKEIDGAKTLARDNQNTLTARIAKLEYTVGESLANKTSDIPEVPAEVVDITDIEISR